ncbi:MAG TPA: hypothetical protein VNI01_04075 [Elusimicrobiota bacterium]|jgi:hypothetical protein|nr:hypothetical protein [Elusimicrobiota bacterium]
MSLRHFHVVFISTALAFMAFLLYWAGTRYVQQAAPGALPLALSAAAGLALGVPYLRWFLAK